MVELQWNYGRLVQQHTASIPSINLTINLGLNRRKVKTDSQQTSEGKVITLHYHPPPWSSERGARGGGQYLAILLSKQPKNTFKIHKNHLKVARFSKNTDFFQMGAWGNSEFFSRFFLFYGQAKLLYIMYLQYIYWTWYKI